MFDYASGQIQWLTRKYLEDAKEEVANRVVNFVKEHMAL